MAAPHGLDWKISLPKYKRALKTTPATYGNQFQLRNLDKNASNYNIFHSPSKRTQSHPSRGNPVIFFFTEVHPNLFTYTRLHLSTYSFLDPPRKLFPFGHS